MAMSRLVPLLEFNRYEASPLARFTNAECFPCHRKLTRNVLGTTSSSTVKIVALFVASYSDAVPGVLFRSYSLPVSDRQHGPENDKSQHLSWPESLLYCGCQRPTATVTQKTHECDVWDVLAQPTPLPALLSTHYTSLV